MEMDFGGDFDVGGGDFGAGDFDTGGSDFDVGGDLETGSGWEANDFSPAEVGPAPDLTGDFSDTATGPGALDDNDEFIDSDINLGDMSPGQSGSLDVQNLADDVGNVSNQDYQIANEIGDDGLTTSSGSEGYGNNILIDSQEALDEKQLGGTDYVNENEGKLDNENNLDGDSQVGDQQTLAENQPSESIYTGANIENDGFGRNSDLPNDDGLVHEIDSTEISVNTDVEDHETFRSIGETLSDNFRNDSDTDGYGTDIDISTDIDSKSVDKASSVDIDNDLDADDYRVGIGPDISVDGDLDGDDGILSIGKDSDHNNDDGIPDIDVGEHGNLDSDGVASDFVDRFDANDYGISTEASTCLQSDLDGDVETSSIAGKNGSDVDNKLIDADSDNGEKSVYEKDDYYDTDGKQIGDKENNGEFDDSNGEEDNPYDRSSDIHEVATNQDAVLLGVENAASGTAFKLDNLDGQLGSSDVKDLGDSANLDLNETPSISTNQNGSIENGDAQLNDKDIEVDESAQQSPQNSDIPQQLQPDEEITLENLEPNTLYEKNGYYYRTDEQGRPIGVYGKLELQDGVRSDEQTKIGHLGVDGDEGGHLIGTRFNGPTDAFNLVPQNSNLNRGEWKAMENDWASAIENGYDVVVDIQPVYGTDDTYRPDFFIVKYDLIDKEMGETIPNRVLIFNQSNKE